MAIYLWLSKLYLGNQGPGEFKELFDPKLLDEIAEALPSAQEPLDRVRKHAEDGLDRLGAEYEQLFIVPVRGKYVPPYESCFREQSSPDDLGDIWSASTQRIIEFYRRAGYEPDLLPNTAAPDHLGIELAFMAKLCSDEMESMAKGNLEEATDYTRLSREFLKDHLLKWVSRYASAVQMSRIQGVYAPLSRLTELFLRQELDDFQR